jgi:hypothetical protein
MAGAAARSQRKVRRDESPSMRSEVVATEVGLWWWWPRELGFLGSKKVQRCRVAAWLKIFLLH